MKLCVVRMRAGLGGEHGGAGLRQLGHGDLVGPGGRFPCYGLCSEHIFIELLLCDRHYAECWGHCG